MNQGLNRLNKCNNIFCEFTCSDKYINHNCKFCCRDYKCIYHLKKDNTYSNLIKEEYKHEDDIMCVNCNKYIVCDKVIDKTEITSKIYNCVLCDNINFCYKCYSKEDFIECKMCFNYICRDHMREDNICDDCINYKCVFCDKNTHKGNKCENCDKLVCYNCSENKTIRESSFLVNNSRYGVYADKLYCKSCLEN